LRDGGFGRRLRFALGSPDPLFRQTTLHRVQWRRNSLHAMMTA
jgi:hypothetical protein